MATEAKAGNVPLDREDGQRGLTTRATMKRCRLFALLILVSLIFSPCCLLADADTWSVKAGMPTPRVLHGACEVHGKIYVFGGQSIRNGPAIASVEEYDPQGDTWRARSDMPTARMSMTINAVDNKCYLIGGFTTLGSNRESLDLVEEYDPETDSWRQRSAMFVARGGAASAVIDGKIYVAGGFAFGNPYGAVVAALNIYDPAGDSWSAGAAMPSARGGMAAISSQGKLYVFGGGGVSVGTMDSNLVHRYDPLTDTWSQLAGLGTRRAGPTASEVNGRLFVIGGGAETGPQTTLEEYHADTDSWTQGPAMPTARWGAMSSEVNGTVFVLGGSTEWGDGHNGLSTNEAFASSGFRINPGLSDAWFNPATNGQGMLITVFPDLQQMFLAWFTFDTERPPQDVTAILGEPGHRWLTAQGPYSGETATLKIYVTKGGVFDSAAPVVETDLAGDGTMTLEFADCANGLVSYEITSLGVSGEIPIQRIAPDNIALCETLGGE